MKKSEIFELESRQCLYTYIKNNPGLHLRELSRRLHISYHNLRYHVNYLKKLNLIAIKSDNSYSRLYVTNKIGLYDQKILNIIRQKIPRYIILVLHMWIALTEKELSEYLEKHPTTIEYHLKKLLRRDVIEVAPVKYGFTLTNIPNKILERSPIHNEILYRLKDPYLIDKLLISYKKSLFKDKIFKDLMQHTDRVNNLYVEDRRYIKVKNFKTINHYEDKLLEMLSDIFPHPYHIGSKWF